MVAVVVCNGQILREIRNPGSDDVRLPFGSEYSLRFKNLNNVRAAISVTVDGEDVLDGHRLVLDANETTDLEGFMDGSAVRNRFKFINKTKEISDFRGDRLDDGIIRIEYQFEKPPVRYTPRHTSPWWNRGNHGTWSDNEIYYKGSTTCGFDTPIGSSGNVLRSREVKTRGDIRMQSLAPEAADFSKSLMDDSFQNQTDEGITVKGSKMYQHYNRTYLGAMEEQTHVIIFNLKGTTGEAKKVVKKPVTVKTKVRCETCGRKFNARTKYCPNCGTCLS